MPIAVTISPDPLTPAASTTPPVLAECLAYRALYRSMVRYAEMGSAGRSVLLAGHRGAGKTTLVRWAVQQAQELYAGGNAASRALFVPLHGPDLLGGEAMLAPTGESPAAPPCAC
jgi:hypothetical protein